MKRTLRYGLLVLLCLAYTTAGHTQSLEERLQKFGDDFAKGYTGPFVDAFGAALNSGWYSTANVDNGVSIYIGVKVMAMPIPDDGKKFMIASPYDGVVQEVPTAFGEDKEVLISRTNIPGVIIVDPDKYPKGFNIGFVPMAVPQISVGNIFGTRVMLRYFPKTKLGDYGDFEFFGLGVQHSVSQYLPTFPLDLSGMVAYQNLSLGSLVSAKAFTFGAQASKSLSLLTVYGGLAYEKSNMSFSYTATFTDPSNPTQKISKQIGYDKDGKNNVRATVGLSLSLLIIKINADYTLASQPVASVGIGIGW